MTDCLERCSREWLDNRTTVLMLSRKNFMSLDGRSTVIFYDLVYLENFVLITRGFHPLDPPNDQEQCMCKVSCTDLLDFIWVCDYHFKPSERG